MSSPYFLKELVVLCGKHYSLMHITFMSVTCCMTEKECMYELFVQLNVFSVLFDEWFLYICKKIPDIYIYIF